jgi:hypothetical protein
LWTTWSLFNAFAHISIYFQPTYTTQFIFIGLAYYYQEGKDIVLRFIIEYSSFRDFYRPLGNNNNNNNRSIFYMRIFQKKEWYFWLVLKLEISYRTTISWRIFVFFLEGFLKIIYLHCEIFWFSHNSSFALRYLFNVNGQGHSVKHPLFLFWLGSWIMCALCYAY